MTRPLATVCLPSVVLAPGAISRSTTNLEPPLATARANVQSICARGHTATHHHGISASGHTDRDNHLYLAGGHLSSVTPVAEALPRPSLGQPRRPAPNEIAPRGRRACINRWNNAPRSYMTRQPSKKHWGAQSRPISPIDLAPPGSNDARDHPKARHRGGQHTFFHPTPLRPPSGRSCTDFLPWTRPGGQSTYAPSTRPKPASLPTDQPTV